MTAPRSSRRIRPLALLALFLLTSCIAVREVTVRELPRVEGTSVGSPVKAHLHDGGVVVFADGVFISRDSILATSSGPGRVFDATLEPTGFARAIALSDVLGVEVYRETEDPGQGLVYSFLAIAAAKGLITFALAGGDISPIKAVFGSCPTIYSDSAGVPVLEAESFSSSIAPLLARRDVDRLRVRADENGRVRLEVRNEALETHHIDQLQLIEIEHAAHERVVPAPFGAALVLSDAQQPVHARDRSGRDVLADLRAPDDRMFASSEAAFARVTDEDAVDWIDLTVPRPDGDSVAVVMRVRSSLLTTLLFYDRMLARPGAHALDWLASDMFRIATVAQFGRWYGANMTLRVQVVDGNETHEVARLADIGPIAWREVAVMVPVVGEADSLHVRLAFTTDQWRIDHVELATPVRRAPGRVLEPTVVQDPLGEARADVLEAIRDADDRFVVTQPAERFFVEFQGAMPGTPRTYLLGAQGYYIEWMRADWLREATGEGPFDPASVRPSELLREWHMQRDSMEELFYSTRIPVV